MKKQIKTYKSFDYYLNKLIGVIATFTSLFFFSFNEAGCVDTVSRTRDRGKKWSGSRESNPLPNRWQRFALPMS